METCAFPKESHHLAGCGKKDFRRLLPLSYLSQRERRLRKEASFYLGCGTAKWAIAWKTSFFRTLLMSCWTTKIAREVEVMIVREDRVERQLLLMEISALTAAHLCTHPNLMFYNGKVVVAADYVQEHSFVGKRRTPVPLPDQVEDAARID